MSHENEISSAGLLMGSARLGLAKFTETESILPFALTHKTVANPALAAWNAAPSNPCGLHCLNPELDVYCYVPAGAKAVAYVFHGGEGSAEMWITGEEEAALVGDLVRDGYAVVLLESTHRPVDRNWFFPDPARFDPANLNHPETPLARTTRGTRPSTPTSSSCATSTRSSATTRPWRSSWSASPAARSSPARWPIA